MTHQLSRLAILLIWTGLMASSFVVSEYIVPFANPIATTGMRFVLAMCLMLPFVYKQLGLITKDIFTKYFVISFFLVVFFLGLFESLKTTTALNTSVIYTLVPLISVVLSLFLLREKTAPMKLIGYGGGSVGAIWVLVVGNDIGIGFDMLNIGDVIFFGASICLAAHIVLIKKWASDVPVTLGTFLILFTGTLMLIPVMIVTDAFDSVHWNSFVFWEYLMYLTVFTTLLTFGLQQYLVRKAGPNTLLAFSYLIPTLVAVSQGVLFSDHLLAIQPGILLTMLSLYLIVRNVSPGADYQVCKSN